MNVYTPNYSGPIQLIAKPGWYVGLFMSGQWKYMQVQGYETVPESRNVSRNFGNIVAGGQSALTLVTELQVPSSEFIQMRVKPIDDVEAEIYVPSAIRKWSLDQVAGRVDWWTQISDPYYASTEFYVMGSDRDANMVVYNRTDYALNPTRFHFWGFRYLVDVINVKDTTPDEREKIKKSAMHIMNDFGRPQIDWEVL